MLSPATSEPTLATGRPGIDEWVAARLPVVPSRTQIDHSANLATGHSHCIAGGDPAGDASACASLSSPHCSGPAACAAPHFPSHGRGPTCVVSTQPRQCEDDQCHDPDHPQKSHEESQSTVAQIASVGESRGPEVPHQRGERPALRQGDTTARSASRPRSSGRLAAEIPQLGRRSRPQPVNLTSSDTGCQVITVLLQPGVAEVRPTQLAWPPFRLVDFRERGFHLPPSRPIPPAAPQPSPPLRSQNGRHTWNTARCEDRNDTARARIPPPIPLPSAPLPVSLRQWVPSRPRLPRQPDPIDFLPPATPTDAAYQYEPPPTTPAPLPTSRGRALLLLGTLLLTTCGDGTTTPPTAPSLQAAWLSLSKFVGDL